MSTRYLSKVYNDEWLCDNGIEIKHDADTASEGSGSENSAALTDHSGSDDMP